MQDETLQSVRLNAENKKQLTLKAEGKFGCMVGNLAEHLWIRYGSIIPPKPMTKTLINPSN